MTEQDQADADDLRQRQKLELKRGLKVELAPELRQELELEIRHEREQDRNSPGKTLGDVFGENGVLALLGVLVAGVVAIVVVLVTTGGGKSSAPEPAPTAATSVDELAHQLATLDATRSNEGVYASLLRGLLSACPEATAQELSDLSVRTRQVLKDRGVAVDNRGVLEGVTGSLAGLPSASVKCQDTFVAWATLRAG